MIKKKLLKEDSAAAAVNSADHGQSITINSSDVKLTDLLDELLERNLETFNINLELLKDGELPDKNFVNLLVVGIGGTGKTSIIEQWAHSRHLNLVTKAASIMDEAELNGIPVANNEDQSARMLRMNEFDALDEPDSVLFLDEFNRGRATVRGTLLKLIQGHTIPDPSVKGGIKFLPNLLFTIAAINPADPNYNTDQLDDAELSRFIIYLQEGADKYEYLDWITKTLKRRSEILGRIQKQDSRMKSSSQALAANQRRLNLITFLINDKRFMFDDSSDIEKAHAAARGDTLPATILSFRTLTQALYASDGTVDSFLYYYRQGANRDKFELVKLILTPYKEKQDKANKALDQYEQETIDPLFKSEAQLKRENIVNLRKGLLP